MGLLAEIFTWWNGRTLGTRLYTARKGELVGKDGEGNIYYRNKDNTRRWVIYNGEVHASRIPPEWHGWMHYTVDEPPTESAMYVKPWEQAHEPNPTGGPTAYAPPGSLYGQTERGAATGDYEAWTPGK